MSLKLANNAISTLASSIIGTDLSLSVAPGTGSRFPTLGAGEYFPATLVRASDGAQEIVTVTARVTDVFTVTRAQESTSALSFSAGDRVELRLTAKTFTDQAVEVVTHAATSKTTPVDADEFPMVDSDASNGLKKLTWSNIKASIFSVLGALIAAETAKTTPDDADVFLIADSAASNANKKISWADMYATAKVALKAYFDTLYLTIGSTLASGYSCTPYNAGTKSSGTFTPAASNGNQQYCTNGGAFTLAPPSTATSIVLEVTNNGSAGAITTSGFTKVLGSFTTTNGHKFVCNIIKTQSYSLLQIQGLQ